jgi:hypothetical protein
MEAQRLTHSRGILTLHSSVLLGIIVLLCFFAIIFNLSLGGICNAMNPPEVFKNVSSGFESSAKRFKKDGCVITSGGYNCSDTSSKANKKDRGWHVEVHLGYILLFSASIGFVVASIVSWLFIIYAKT